MCEAEMWDIQAQIDLSFCQVIFCLSTIQVVYPILIFSCLSVSVILALIYSRTYLLIYYFCLQTLLWVLLRPAFCLALNLIGGSTGSSLLDKEECAVVRSGLEFFGK